MNIKIDTKVALTLAAAIGVIFLSGAAAYKNIKQFREWFDNKFYPAAELFINEQGPTILRKILIKTIENKPEVKEVFLNLADFLENGSGEIPNRLLKELYKLKDELLSVKIELEKIANIHN